ncbi:hypothetical protein [Steroidobacter agaridevorans]|uniref:hypothetical protein n=1 Tax=Steroidobacter agaridevorans TaxID=2695856 RepID=UPI00132C32D0|nr:hypothetical protein [Steroidobacter agaridevorans]GFE86542.1 hypothetical protein GCM10011488_14960 [Steroidobacter agaridevorans]
MSVKNQNRRLLATLALLCSITVADGAEIGVNFNGMLARIDQGDLARAKTTWIRGFVDYYQFRSGAKNVATDPGLEALSQAHQAGYKTIINIKFDFTSKNFPTTAAQIDTELNYLDTLLAALYADCDIIVIGNEPFIESISSQRGAPLFNFYTAAAERTKTYKDGQSRKIPLYIGAFNRLWEAGRQTEATPLLQYAEATPWLAGVDLHIHHSANAEIDNVFAFVNPRIRGDQKILVTEYSLMHHWKAHLNDPIPAQLAAQYGRPAQWKVWEYINYVQDDPVTRPEWVAFLQNSPWFENRKDYIANSYAKFAANAKFNIGAYAMYQGYFPGFNASTDPWILNPLFVNQTVMPNPSTGLNQTNYSYFDAFRALQP